MRKLVSAGAAMLTLAFGSPAQAVTVLDAPGDFLASFVGPNDADLDVISFSVDFDSLNSVFVLDATLNGVIDPLRVGYYVIGVNTGLGAIAPFGSIGQPDVRFDRALVIFKDGSGVEGIGGTPLPAGSVTISGNQFTAHVPLSLLPSTGFTPLQYGFNLWPRNGLNPQDNGEIADFAPENALLAIAPVPEPATWMLMIAGFGVAGSALRRRTRMTVQTAG